MEKSIKTVAWLCILSILSSGCRTSALIDPTGEEKEGIQSDYIEFAVMNDSTKYVFGEPAAIVNGTIVGQVTRVIKNIEVSIPTSEVAQIHESHSGSIQYVVTKAGVKYAFERPPAIINKSIVGPGKVEATESMKVSLSLADVAEISVREFDVGATVALVVGTAIVGMLVYNGMKHSGGGSPAPGGLTLGGWPILLF